MKFKILKILLNNKLLKTTTMKPHYKPFLRRGIAMAFLCLAPLVLFAQYTLIPDPNFEQALIDLGIDSDGIVNGHVLTSDIESVVELDVRYKNINDLTGIEDFAALEELTLRGNNLTTLDMSGNTQLKILNCLVNPLHTINVTQNLLLESLDLTVLHRLDEIDLSQNINLETLIMNGCWIKSIDLSHNINLKNLYAEGSDLLEIDLSNNLLLEFLDVFGVELESLDVSNNILLKELYCGNHGGVDNQTISELDLSNNSNLEVFHAENLFLIESLNLKNNNNNDNLLVTLSCVYGDEPCQLTELQCIEVDDPQAGNNNEFPYNTWYINAEFYYSEDCALGTADFWNETDITLYPNPTADGLVLATSDEVAISEVRIFDINGRLLEVLEFQIDKEVSIDVSHLAGGIYFLRIKDDIGISMMKKFIKQ